MEIYEDLAQNANTWASISTELAQKAGQYMQWVEILAHYQQFTRVSVKVASHRLPQHKPWDHAIELKKDAPAALNCKVYPLTAAKKVAL